MGRVGSGHEGAGGPAGVAVRAGSGRPGLAGPPALQQGGQLLPEEDEEVVRVGETLAGRGPGAQDLGPVPGGAGPVGEQLVPAEGDLIPEVVAQQVHVAAAAGLTLTADHADV